MLDSSSVQSGEPVTLSGVLTPNPGVTEIMILLHEPDGSTNEWIIASDSNGGFSESYTPKIAGLWSLSARWIGVSGYGGAVSEPYAFQVTLPVVEPEPSPEPDEPSERGPESKKTSRIYLDWDAPESQISGNELKFGTPVSITVTLKDDETNQPIDNAYIIIAVIDPTGGLFRQYEGSAENGVITYGYTPELAGMWRMVASWEGNDEYEGDSHENSFKMVNTGLLRFIPGFSLLSIILGISVFILVLQNTRARHR